MIAYVDSVRIQFINKAFERTMRVWREQVVSHCHEIFTDAEYQSVFLSQTCIRGPATTV